MSGSVLIVEDDAIVGASLRELMRSWGWTAEAVGSAEEALVMLGADGAPGFDLVLTDLSLPGMHGIGLIRELGKRRGAPGAVVLTGYGTVDSAVESMRAGAMDVLTKPVIDDELRASLERALELRAMTGGGDRPERPEWALFLEGEDPRIARVVGMIEAAAPTASAVLLAGERGTGKRQVARAIHEQSPRRGQPMVELCCSSLAPETLEGMIFGTERGEGTPGTGGLIRDAGNGTVFLDDAHTLPARVGERLLRAMHEGVVSSDEAGHDDRIGARFVLGRTPGGGSGDEFFRDLFARMDVVSVELPALRERASDIPALAEAFLAVRSAEVARVFTGFTEDAMALLRAHPYPGNIRELQAMVVRSTLIASGQVITADDLPEELRGASEAGREPGPWIPTPLSEALKGPERGILVRALEANGWNRSRAADDLGINRTTLYKKMKALGIDERRLAG